MQDLIHRLSLLKNLLDNDCDSRLNLILNLLFVGKRNEIRFCLSTLLLHYSWKILNITLSPEADADVCYSKMSAKVLQTTVETFVNRLAIGSREMCGLRIFGIRINGVAYYSV